MKFLKIFYKRYNTLTKTHQQVHTNKRVLLHIQFLDNDTLKNSKQQKTEEVCLQETVKMMNQK